MIAFRDGNPYITDYVSSILAFIFNKTRSLRFNRTSFSFQSTNGTFVNDVRIETETKLSENDKITLGIHPDTAEVSRPDTYIFTVIRQEVVELEDSDDGDVEFVDGVDSGNESGDVRELQGTPDEEMRELEKDAEGDDGDSQLRQGNTAEQESKKENVQLSSTSVDQPTSSSNQPSTSRGLLNFALNDQLKKKSDNLRRWNKNAPQLIEPQPMKKRRKKKESHQPVAGPSNGSLPQGAPKKRGRPSKEVKEKLAAIVPPKDDKPKDPKPKRDVKIKMTKHNRGSFLCKPLNQNENDVDTSEDTE